MSSDESARPKRSKPREKGHPLRRRLARGSLVLLTALGICLSVVEIRATAVPTIALNPVFGVNGTVLVSAFPSFPGRFDYDQEAGEILSLVVVDGTSGLDYRFLAVSEGTGSVTPLPQIGNLSLAAHDVFDLEDFPSSPSFAWCGRDYSTNQAVFGCNANDGSGDAATCGATDGILPLVLGNSTSYCAALTAVEPALAPPRIFGGGEADGKPAVFTLEVGGGLSSRVLSFPGGVQHATPVGDRVIVSGPSAQFIFHCALDPTTLDLVTSFGSGGCYVSDGIGEDIRDVYGTVALGAERLGSLEGSTTSGVTTFEFVAYDRVTGSRLLLHTFGPDGPAPSTPLALSARASPLLSNSTVVYLLGSSQGSVTSIWAARDGGFASEPNEGRNELPSIEGLPFFHLETPDSSSFGHFTFLGLGTPFGIRLAEFTTGPTIDFTITAERFEGGCFQTSWSPASRSLNSSFCQEL